MNINTDINILGGLPDWNLIKLFMNDPALHKEGNIHSFTALKTERSVIRFEKAISTTVIKFANPDIETLVHSMTQAEDISNDTLLLLFWNSSFNNDLLHYLNTHVYFTHFYSGRISIKQDEVVACLKDLKEREAGLKKWADYTLTKVGSKYLTLIKKFNLMEGSLNKTIIHPYLNDKMFILFVYWLRAVEKKSNLLDSDWLSYSFSEKTVFLERLMQKKFASYFDFTYTGDKLKIDTLVPYPTLYYAIR